MKTKLFALLALALLLCSVNPAVAQTAISSTTTSAAVAQSDTTVQLTSVTGISGTGAANLVQTMIYIDRELMAVTVSPTYSGGTTVAVQRGQSGTPIQSHVSGATVWYGPPSYFPYGNPSGACTPPTTQAVTPYIAVSTGDLFQCSTQGSTSQGYWVGFAPFISRLVVGSQLTAAATLTITAPVHHITSSATTVTTITVPSALPALGGCIRLIPDAAMTGMTTSVGGNIALASTAVANKVLELCYDAAQSKWYPSY